jgi:hypothetical protein
LDRLSSSSESLRKHAIMGGKNNGDAIIKADINSGDIFIHMRDELKVLYGTGLYFLLLCFMLQFKTRSFIISFKRTQHSDPSLLTSA